MPGEQQVSVISSVEEMVSGCRRVVGAIMTCGEECEQDIAFCI